MSEFLISREIGIDAGHRVPTHGSKCANTHGHRYKIVATCSGPLADDGEQAGMVLDFGFLKDEMMKVIDAVYDHALIAWASDPLLPHLRQCCGKLVIVPYIPTAENLARLWFDELAPLVVERSDRVARLACIDVWETPNCIARYPAV